MQALFRSDHHADAGGCREEDRRIHGSSLGINGQKIVRPKPQQTPIHQAFSSLPTSPEKQQYASHNGQNNGQMPRKHKKQPISNRKAKAAKSIVSRLCGFLTVVGVSRFELEASWSRNSARGGESDLALQTKTEYAIMPKG